VCQINLEPDHVRLALFHGAFARDSDGLLEGDQKTKRFIRIFSFDDAPWSALHDLIAASAGIDPSSSRCEQVTEIN
jgi:hypothetical protein